MTAAKVIQMEYNSEIIKRLFSRFWKERKSDIKYYKNGRTVLPGSIEKCVVIDLRPGDYSEGCNFEARLDLGDVYIDGVGRPTLGIVLFCVDSEIDSDSHEPKEVIKYIKDNRIDIKCKY